MDYEDLVPVSTPYVATFNKELMQYFLLME